MSELKVGDVLWGCTDGTISKHVVGQCHLADGTYVVDTQNSSRLLLVEHRGGSYYQVRCDTEFKKSKIDWLEEVVNYCFEHVEYIPSLDASDIYAMLPDVCKKIKEELF